MILNYMGQAQITLRVLNDVTDLNVKRIKIKCRKYIKIIKKFYFVCQNRMCLIF